MIPEKQSEYSIEAYPYSSLFALELYVDELYGFSLHYGPRISFQPPQFSETRALSPRHDLL
jgi:hypothetical protein